MQLRFKNTSGVEFSHAKKNVLWIWNNYNFCFYFFKQWDLFTYFIKLGSKISKQKYEFS